MICALIDKSSIIRAMDWTTRELAEAAGVTADFITQDIRRGTLKAVKRGMFWLIADEDAQAWLSNPRRGSRSKSSKRGVDADSKSGNL